jgi:hypothetical protein
VAAAFGMNALACYAWAGAATWVACQLNRVRLAVLEGDGDRKRNWLAVARNEAFIAAVALAAWPLLAGLLIAYWLSNANHPEPDKPFAVLPEHLSAPLDLEEIERRERVSDPLGAVPDLPFGHLHGAWQEFLAKRSPAQSIRAFDAAFRQGGRDWRRCGYALVSEAGIGPCFVTVSRATSPAPPLDTSLWARKQLD